MIFSGLAFVVVNFFVKLLGGGSSQSLIPDLQDYPAHELVLARSIVSFVISATIIKYRKLPFWGFNKRWLIIRGLAGSIALTLFFYTLHFLPMAVAAIVQYLSPIFTVILASILLKEKVRLLQWFLIIISFGGVLMIGIDQINSSDVSNPISLLWLGIGILSSGFSGIAYIAIMKLKRSDEPITIVMYFPLIATPITLFMCLFDFTMPRGIEWFILLIIGVFTQIAQIMLTKALHHGQSSYIMPFQYLGIIYAFMIGLFVFGEQLSFIVNLGIVIVLSGVLTNVMIRNKGTKPN